MEIIQFHARIKTIMKIIEFQNENQRNHGKHIIPQENNEN